MRPVIICFIAVASEGAILWQLVAAAAPDTAYSPLATAEQKAISNSPLRIFPLAAKD